MIGLLVFLFVGSFQFTYGFINQKNFPSLRSNQFICERSLPILLSKPSVGDLLIGEVDDIVGTLDEPAVAFKIKSGNDVLKAMMPTKSLSPMERLTLQAGSVLQVQVTNIDGNEIVVTTKAKNLDNKKDNSKSKSSTTTKKEPVSFQAWSDAPTSGYNMAIRNTINPKKSDSTTSKRPKTSKSNGPPGLLIGSLKTGMNFTGVITTLTQYAAFVDMNIYRKAKGDTYKRVNGMLHFSDLTDDTVLATNRKANHGKSKGLRVLDKGALVTVYVKEVLKNAGRFTLTLDSTISKSRIIETKQQIKEEGLARRRSRRVRRRLSTIYPGDTVEGHVKEVVEEGILVTLTSLGPLNITGLISKKDLPKQFQVPPDLKDSFQIQLLEQDFTPGRSITCGVEKVNTKWHPRMLYNVKLTYEELGPEVDDNIHISDDVSISSEYDDLDDDEDDDDDEDPFFSEEELLEAYDELKDKKGRIPVHTFKNWSQMTGLMDEKLITMDDINKVMKDVGVKKDDMNYDEFADVTVRLQELADDNADNIYIDNDEDDDEKSIKLSDLPTKSSPIVMNQKNDKSNKNAASSTKTTPSTQDDDEAEDDDDDEEEDMSDEEFDEMMKEVYNELKGNKKQLSMKAFMEWDEIQDMIDEELIDKKDIKDAMKEIGVKGDNLTYEEFYDVYSILEDIAIGEDDGEEEDDDDMDEIMDESVDKSSKGFGKKEEISTKSTEIKANAKDSNSDDNDDDNVELEDEAEYIAQLQEIFNELKGKDGKVTVKSFKEWDEIQEMVEDGVLTQTTIDDIIQEAELNKNKMSFEEFKDLYEAIDNEAVFSSDDVDDDDDDDMDNNDVDDDEEDESDEDDDYEALLEESYNELKDKNGKVTIDKFMQFEDIKEVLDEGLVTVDDVKEALLIAGVKGKEMTLEQFIQAFESLKDLIDTTEGDDDNDDDIYDDNNSAVDNDDDDNDDEGEDDDEGLVEEAFNELRGKNAKVSIQTFLEFDEIKECIDEGLLSKDEILQVFKDVGVKKDMTLDEFSTVFNILQKKIDEAEERLAAIVENKSTSDNTNNKKDTETADTDDEEDEDEEEEEEEEDLSYEEELETAFKKLKGNDNKVTLAAFEKWDVIQDMIKDESITVADIKQACNDAEINGNKLDFEEFIEVYEILDEFAYADDEDDDDDDEDEDDDGDMESLRKELQDEFNKLKDKNNLIPIKSLYTWEPIQEMIEDDLISKDDINDFIKGMEIQTKNKLNEEEFIELYMTLEDMAIGDDDDDDDDDEGGYVDDDEDDDDNTPPLPPTTSGSGSSSKNSVTGSIASNTGKSSKVTSTKGGNTVMSFQSNDAKQFFNTYKDKKSNLLSIPILLQNQPDIQQLLKDQLLDDTSLTLLIEETGANSKQGLTYEQLVTLYEMLSEYSVVVSTDDFDDEVRNEVLNSTDDIKSTTDNVKNSDIKSNDMDINDEEITTLLKSIFDDMKSKKTNKVKIQDILSMSTIRDALNNNQISIEIFNTIIKESNLNPTQEINFDQFVLLLDKLDEKILGTTDKSIDKYINNDEEDEEMDEAEKLAMMREIFNDIGPEKKSDTITLKQFKNWDNILEAIQLKHVTMKGIDSICQSLQVKDKINFKQFVALLDGIEDILVFDETTDNTASSTSSTDNSEADDSSNSIELMSSSEWKSKSTTSAAASTSTSAVASGTGFKKVEEGNKKKKEHIKTSERLEADALAEELFDDLRGKNKVLSVTTFRNWSDLKDLLASGAIKQTALERALVKVGSYDNNSINLKQFIKLIDFIQEETDPDKLTDSYEKQIAKYGPVEDDDEEEEVEVEVAKIVVDKKKEKNTTVVATKKEESSTQNSEIDTQLALFNSKQNKVLKLDDTATTTKDKTSSTTTSSSKTNNNNGETLQALFESEIDSSEEDYYDDLSEEDATLELFNELKPNKDSNTLPLVEFIKWDDVQELLNSGALSKDDLANAIEKTGTTVENGDLNFETFYDLVRIIEDYIDKDQLSLKYGDLVYEETVKVDMKNGASQVIQLMDDLTETYTDDEEDDDDGTVMGLNDDDDDDDDDEDDILDLDDIDDDDVDLDEDHVYIENSDLVKNGLKVSYKKGNEVYEGSDAIEVMQKDVKKAKKQQDEDDQEVIEMFEEISKGKDFITEKQLRKWDELRDTVDSGFIDMKTVDGYIKRLNIPPNGRITLPIFKQFMDMMDQILVDENGNFLSLEDEDQAINIQELLGGINDDDDEDE